MTQNFPYGDSQSLTCGTVTLDLTECNFFSTDNLPAGYERRYVEGQLPEVQYSITGEPIIRTTCHTPKYTFTWNLLLKAEEVITLYSLLVHQMKFTREKDAQYAITLTDNRVIEVETFPITRQQTGTPVDVTGLNIPPDTALYFPVFKIKIDEPSGWRNWLFELDDQMTYQVELTGQELDFV